MKRTSPASTVSLPTCIVKVFCLNCRKIEEVGLLPDVVKQLHVEPGGYLLRGCCFDCTGDFALNLSNNFMRASHLQPVTPSTLPRSARRAS